MDSAHQRGLNQRHFFSSKTIFEVRRQRRPEPAVSFLPPRNDGEASFACQSHEHKSIDPGVRIAHVVQPVFHFFLYITKNTLGAVSFAICLCASAADARSLAP